MWRCRECGGEVVRATVICNGKKLGKMDEYEEVFEEELVEWDDYTQFYQCSECGNVEDYYLEEIAYWDGDN